MLHSSRNALRGRPLSERSALHCRETGPSYLAGAVNRPRMLDGHCIEEESAFYVPDLLADSRFEVDPEAYSAADAYARHLRKAEGLLGDALNLSGVLRASLGDAADSRTAQAETVLKLMEKQLSKAHRAIDKHGRRHSNLFLAYCELRKGRGGEVT